VYNAFCFVQVITIALLLVFFLLFYSVLCRFPPCKLRFTPFLLLANHVLLRATLFYTVLLLASHVLLRAFTLCFYFVPLSFTQCYSSHFYLFLIPFCSVFSLRFTVILCPFCCYSVPVSQLFCVCFASISLLFFSSSCRIIGLSELVIIYI